MPVSDSTARRFVFNVLQFSTDVQISRTVIDHIDHMLTDQEEDLPFFFANYSPYQLLHLCIDLKKS
jgi:hypothetical protein